MATAPSSRPDKGEDRRIAIAEAARGLIAERGFEGLRTREIAARVGINVATLHYHVPTKEALIQIVARSLRDEFIAQHLARPRDGSAAERLDGELEDFRETMQTRPGRMLVFAELIERARRDPEVEAAIRPMLAYWHAQLAAILRLGRDDGSFRADLDPEAAAAMIVGALRGLLSHPEAGAPLFESVAAELRRAVLNPFSQERPQ